ncbi:tripartite tricarboxylate transporter substrate binding protein [Cereibacter sphaeroides]|uniref:Bug family tripartite tricarboxylate transporter substrate binding protein n=1 Tax=Cereibacter sphaeroides TaxID=1063 RepID=UPI0039909B19
MKITTKTMLLASAMTGLVVTGTAASAADFACSTLRWIVPYSAGGGLDWATRLVTEGVSQKLGGVAIVVDNRAGATGAVGGKEAMNAKADGCTILSTTSSMVVNQAVKGHEGVGFDLLTDFTPIVALASSPYFITANADLGVKTLPELLTKAKEKPNEIPYSTSGKESLQALTYGLLKSQAGVEMIEIPYKGGGEMFADFLSGRVPLFLAYPYEVKDYVAEGKANYLAVTSAERHSLLPEVPTVAETLPGFEILQTYGVVAPAGTPPEVVAKLNAAIGETLASEDVAKKLQSETSFVVKAGPPEAYGEMLKKDLEQFRSIASDLGLVK